MTFPCETLLHKNNNEKDSEKVFKFKIKGKLKRVGANKGGYWKIINKEIYKN